MKKKASHRLLIRLTQQAPTSSVGACPGLHSPKACGSSRLNSPPKTLAGSIWPDADGRKGSSAHTAVIAEHT